jgi:hypothetical protein
MTVSLIVCIYFNPATSKVVFAQLKQQTSQNQASPSDIACATASNPGDQSMIEQKIIAMNAMNHP